MATRADMLGGDARRGERGGVGITLVPEGVELTGDHDRGWEPGQISGAQR